jgi:site-specific DNA-methyltransferase (adenine-specific)
MRELDLLVSLHKAKGKDVDETLTKLALAQGMSKGHYHRKHKVWEAARNGEQYAIDLVKKLDTNQITVDKAYREVREHENLVKSKSARKIAEASGRKLPATSDLIFGDFVKVLDGIPDNTVDAIICDPPYPAQFLPEWKRLATFAARKLRPGGWLVAYSGQLHLPKIMSMFVEETQLVYYWTLALLHEGGGGSLLVQTVNMTNQWKPVIVYQKQHGDAKTGTVIKIANACSDLVSSPKREKEGHEWQQSEGGVARLFEIFTEKDDLVVDPFAGTATTILVGTQLHRKCIGAEIDEVTYQAAKLRLQTCLSRKVAP